MYRSESIGRGFLQQTIDFCVYSIPRATRPAAIAGCKTAVGITAGCGGGQMEAVVRVGAGRLNISLVVIFGTESPGSPRPATSQIRDLLPHLTYTPWEYSTAEPGTQACGKQTLDSIEFGVGGIGEGFLVHPRRRVSASQGLGRGRGRETARQMGPAGHRCASDRNTALKTQRSKTVGLFATFTRDHRLPRGRLLSALSS